MSRKCACCDTHNDLTFVSDAEDFYCLSCYYETYELHEFDIGKMLCELSLDSTPHSDVALLNAIKVFIPNGASDYGYLAGLKSELEDRGYRVW